MAKSGGAKSYYGPPTFKSGGAMAPLAPPLPTPLPYLQFTSRTSKPKMWGSYPAKGLYMIFFS